MIGLKPVLVGLIGIAAVLAACDRSSADAQPKPVSPQAAIVGNRYIRSDPAPSELKLLKTGEHWRMEIEGASPPEGAATAADCALVAVGGLSDGTFIGVVVPFETDTMSVSAESLVGRPHQVEAGVTPTKVTVTKADSWGICGLAADLAGDYASASGD